jgi:hypothetical protein
MASRTPKGWGIVRSRGSTDAQRYGGRCAPAEGSGEQRPGSIPGICPLAARDPGHPDMHSLALTVAAPPNTRASAATVMRPHTNPPYWPFVAAAEYGEGSVGIWSVFASGGAPGRAVPVGGRRNRESPRTPRLWGA